MWSAILVDGEFVSAMIQIPITLTGGFGYGGLINTKTVNARSFWAGGFGNQSARGGGLGLGWRGVEFVRLATGGGVGDGRGRFGGGGGGGDDDGSDGESGGHIPRQSSGILAWYSLDSVPVYSLLTHTFSGLIAFV